MGRSSSKLIKTPNNPLEELQLGELKREQRKRNKERELKQIAKIQKKHGKNANTISLNKKKNKKTKNSIERNSLTKRSSSCAAAGGQRLGSLNSQSICYEINKEEFNRQIEQKTQTQLDTDLCTFIMNQISLTMQFFANYESEIPTISEEMLAKEMEFNQNLEEHSIFLANPLDAAVAKWIQYKPVHGPNKNNPQPLQPQAMYVIFENIDIARPNDANYDSISPLCKVDMETEFFKTTPSCREDCVNMLKELKWKGYARLKLREDPKMHLRSSSNIVNNNKSEDIYVDGSSSYSNTSANSMKAPSMASSSGYSTESDYDYAYIAHLNVHHPLAELKMCNQRQRCKLDEKVLPESCVSSLGQFIETCHDGDYTDDEESDDYDAQSDDDYSSADENSKDNYKDYETMQAIRLYKIEEERKKMLLQQNFLNSKEFMRYFGELMRHKLAAQLDISAEELNEGTYRGSSIFTKQYEIIPAIHVAQNARDWPDCAFQFRIRERPLSTNPLTGQQFQWPTRSMIKRIETFGFHVIPMGYAPKRQRNPFRELEWRIIFPKAERYLEQHLTMTQVKVFMMTKALVKTFVEPQEKNKALMFTIDHLRMHLFWECEKNFTAWPEEFLGEVLMRFINSFMMRLREKCLRDYFIEERNLFESVPEYSLATLYSILADIRANPLMHLMIAFKNMEFKGNFFPKINLKKLFYNLEENDMLKLKMAAKNSRNLIGMDNEEDEPLLMIDEGAKGLVGMKQHRERTNGKLRRKTHLMRHNIEMKKKQECESKRKSVESIDVEFFFTKNLNNPRSGHINQGVENLRRTNILEIILDHLLLMAEKAIELHAVYLAQIYLAQARRLCKFYHNYGCDMGANEYVNTIHNIDDDISALMKREDIVISPPALPIRTSIEPMRSHQTKDLLEKIVPSANRKICAEVHPKVTIHHSTISETPKSKRSIQFKENETLVEDDNDDSIIHDGQSLTMNKSTSPKSLSERRKSIKFTECIAEVHEGTINPTQKPEGYSPVSILRSHAHKIEEEDVNAILTTEDTVEKIPAEEGTNINNNANKSNTESKESLNDERTSIRSKFGSAVGILKSSPMANSKFVKTITSSTEKMMTQLSVEEKRLQLQEILRRKTLQLKGAFNQSSDS